MPRRRPTQKQSSTIDKTHGGTGHKGSRHHSTKSVSNTRITRTTSNESDVGAEQSITRSSRTKGPNTAAPPVQESGPQRMFQPNATLPNFSLLRAVSEYLDLKELWNLRAVSKLLLQDFDHSKVWHTYLLNVANPSISRVQFWLHLVGGTSDSVADSHGQMRSDDPLGDNPEIEAVIWRDVHRTFPQHPLFRQAGGAGQTLVTGILKRCAAMNESVGYCQGMNYVAAVLLTEALELNHDDTVAPPTYPLREQFVAQEGQGARKTSSKVGGLKSSGATSAWTVARVQQAYQCFDSKVERRIVRIMNALISNPKYNMFGLWTNGVPDLRLRLYQLDKIVEVHLPKLQEHLLSIGLKPAQYCSQWFVTLLASTLPPRRLIRLWDLYFLEGWPFFFRVAVALLSLNESEILRMDLEEASKFFRNQQPRRRFFNVSIRTVLATASRLSISEQQLQRLSLEFKQSEVDSQLSLPKESPSRTLRASEEDVAAYLKMEDVALADAATLRQKIESAAQMYVDAAGYHRSTTVAVAKGTKKMKKISKAVASEKDPEAQKYLLAQRQDTAMNLQHSMQEHATAELRLDEARQRRERFSQQLVIVLDDWEVRRLNAAAKIYDEGVSHTSGE